MKKMRIIFASVFLLITLCLFNVSAQVTPPAGWSDFQIGLVNDNTNLINVRMKKALSEGVKLNYRYAYVNNGVDPTTNALSWLFNQWGTDYSKNSSDMGLHPGYVIYMLQEEGGAAALKNNILNSTFMRNYFTSIRTVAEKSNGYKAIFVIEPDTWGYFLQNALEQGTQSDPRLIPANVNNLGAGYEYLADLPNTLSGVAQAIIRTTRRYAPDSYCGLLMSFWSVNANGVTGPPVADGSKGMVYWNQSDVDYSAAKNATFTNQLLSATDRGDFIGVEKNGWSAGNWLVKQNRNDYYWNDTQNAKWVSWSKTLRQSVNLPLLGWQISIGHIGLPNTVNRYEDTFMPYFFTHTQQFIDAGFIGFLAGKGLADCTDFTNLSGNSLEANGSAGDDGWFFEKLKTFDAARPYLGGTVTPTVSITSPANNASFTAGSSVTINASTTGTITKVEFFQGTTKLGEDTSSPYSYTWSNVVVGNYALTAKATISSGTITSSIVNISVTSTGGTNLALNKTTTVSSTENASYPGSFAVDGNATTRWASAFSDPQWIYVDLGATYNITRVKIVWEAAVGKDYKVQTSANASTWTDIKTVTANTALTNDWTGLSGSGRYVRMYGTARGTAYGYSIFSLEVYGTGGTINVLPSAGITAPVNNASYTAPASVTINANASDTDGTVSKVEFYNGTTLLGTDTSSPYSFTWTNVAAGSYALTAKATDNSGGTGVSAVVTISVNPAGNILPTTSITSPANGATFTAPACIVINVNAQDSDGTIAKVDFYNGTTLLGTDITSPYSFSWCSVPAGSYSITAKATDNAGGVGTSTIIMVSMSGGNSNPVANITLPANNATYAAPASVTINATATDSDGTISKVDFYNGTTLLGTDTSSPYAYSWTSVVAGTYTLTAKATDNSNGTGTSAVITIVVNGGGGNCASIAQYVTTNGNYVPGSIVKNVGNQYECKPWPYSGWCNGGALAYAPGTGTNWTDAWILKGSCSAGARSIQSETAQLQDNEDESADMILYPNPGKSSTEHTVTLVFEKNAGDVRVQLIHTNGSTLLSNDYKNVKRELSVSVPSLPDGLYLVRVRGENKSWIRKYRVH